MFKFQKYFGKKKTVQTCPLPGANQVEMRSGGFGWEVNDWVTLDRFLVLGTEGGTFYVAEQELTLQSAQAVQRCLQTDGVRVVQRIVEISQAGRAPKNDPALFALAMCAKLSDELTRAAAYQALPLVARTGTHLFHFAEYCKAFGGLGGNGFKRALGRWYINKDASALALQAIKYQQRDGWSHRDLLRLAHVKAPSADHQAIFQWIVKGWPADAQPGLAGAEKLRLIHAFELAKRTEKVADLVRLIADQRLPHEAVPTEFKQHAAVWEALLASMPPGALLRNLNKLTAVGLLSNTSAATARVREVLGDAKALERARVHPMAVLLALKTYQAGRGFRGKLTWTPVGRIVDALDEAFYLAFRAVTPTARRLCLALDVSGSMGAAVSSTKFLSCKEATGALALVTANVEPSYEMVAFTSGGRGCVTFGQAYGWSTGISPVSITPRMRLDSVIQKLAKLPMGGTDCALPMRWAAKTRTPVDCFVIYTDNESWAGDVHVDQALRDYRQRMGINAKLVSVALSGDRFSVANPDDAGQLDVVGFDTATPNVISDFITG
ncbi:MAG: TROVE domain-containing protein [Lentisphaeria bacterium]|jgi:60 kDa SS-A/Ro ribonucleoprotein|nr:TROVE domain-containing protein [Lentisphaeria bacterium]